MGNFERIKIAIIEDNPIVRSVLKVLLSSYSNIIFEIVLELESLIDFDRLDTSKYQSPDIILLDIRMPEISGLDGIPMLYKSFPDSLIIMITDVEDKDVVMKCIQAGAKGYLSKGFDQQELINGITSVAHGGSFISPAIARKVFDHIRNRNNMIDELTRRQQEIVEGIVEGLSYKLIGYKFGISIDTVREHIKNIYKKLNINSKGELVALLKF
ncbi:response regulator transcription factor [Pedobacter sp. MC2016-24]|uniref:response regulator n=1 Tax=Pedobacter sp. MC2016-24 TaxID=2780090 RepID=UPI00187E4FD8|nr:response regulator transcription factor [Pedobacter sp. MC2016-24]MBE9600469.1 response regulator transcription factor [Pedobacter sp. MC2016-24]